MSHEPVYKDDPEHIELIKSQRRQETRLGLMLWLVGFVLLLHLLQFTVSMHVADVLYLPLLTKETSMLALVLWAVAMFLWLITVLPFQPVAPYRTASGILAWISVALLFVICHGPISLR
jgi:hypothetical protein